MNIKVDFDNIVVKEDKNDFNVKVLMLKGEKGEQGDGEPNVIETVQVNGTALPVTNKTVNVQVPTVDSAISSSSTNPVQNKAIYNALSNKVDNSALNNYYEISEIDELLGDKADAIVVDKKPYYFDSVASMKAYNLKVGDYAITKGYYTANDGGGAIYNVRTKTQNETADEMFVIGISDTIVAELIINNEVNIKSLGAYGDGIHDDTSIFNNALAKIKDFSNNVLLLDKGTYIITDTIEMPSRTKIRTNGYAIIKSTISKPIIHIYYDEIEEWNKHPYMLTPIITGENGGLFITGETSHGISGSVGIYIDST